MTKKVVGFICRQWTKLCSNPPVLVGIAGVGFLIWATALPTPKLAGIADLLKVFVWPSAMLLAIWWFRDEVRVLIPRLVKIGVTGADFRTPERQENIEKTNPPISRDDTLITTRVPDNPFFRGIVKNLHDGALKEEPDDEKKRYDLVVEMLAMERADRFCAVAYSAMIPSQIRFIRYLNNSRSMPLHIADKFFISENDKVLYGGFDFDAWVGFPLSQGFVVRSESFHGLIKVENFNITPLGDYFIFFLDKYNLRYKETLR